MNSLQRPARNRQIPRHCGARGKKQCIILGPDIAYWDVSNEHTTLFKYPNYPDEIRDSATSLKIISNSDIHREILLANILNAIDKLLNSQSEEDILEYWMQSCNHINRKIKIKYKNKIVTADFKKINQKGQAIINYNSKDLIFDGAILNI